MKKLKNHRAKTEGGEGVVHVGIVVVISTELEAKGYTCLREEFEGCLHLIS